MWQIDLYSDTKTQPCAAMREAMARADVGDEQQDEDPTIRALTDRVAALLGKEAAIFLPSGTMANLVSVLVHCGRGDEILADGSSHLIQFETGGPASVAGVSINPLLGRRGMFSLETLADAIRPERRNSPRSRLVWIEQTTNLGGGGVWPLEVLRQVRNLANGRGLAVHIDGARLFNAAVAAQVEPACYGDVADSVFIDFSKGLGAPFGSVLAGSSAFVESARRYKHMLGGAMRQAGVMAAACLYALDHNVARLADDHANAARLANGLRRVPGYRVADPVETNIVICDVGSVAGGAPAVVAALAAAGIRVGAFGPRTLRFITHLGVSRGQINEAVAAIEVATSTCAG